MQVAAHLRIEAARGHNSVQFRRIIRQPANNLLIRLLCAKLDGRRIRCELKIRILISLLPALLLVDDAVINLSYRTHALLHQAYNITCLLRRFRQSYRAREHLPIVIVIRNSVCLLAVPQLQAMLDLAKEFVGRAELVKILAAEVALVMKLLQCKESSARTQPGFCAAINALQALHQKLDLANAAAPDLNIDALRR